MGSSCSRSMGWTIFLLFIFGSSILLLIGLGVGIVRPFVATGDFIQTQCQAENVIEHGENSCTCPSKTRPRHTSGKTENNINREPCYSTFPCIEIWVSYQPKNSEFKHEARIFKVFRSNYRQEQCFSKPCAENEATNRRSMVNMVNKYGRTDSDNEYQCYYNSEDWNEVITSIPSKTSVIVAMVIPGIFFVLSGAALVVKLIISKCK